MAIKLTKQVIASLSDDVRKQLGIKSKTRSKVDSFVAPSVTVEGGVFTAVIPVFVASEANQRGWAKIAGRAVGVKRAVADVLGPHAGLLAPFTEAYHAGDVLKLTFTRLGGKHLDAMANLGRALKSVEDAVAAAMLADDGDPRWNATAQQEPGGPAGVRVKIEVL